MKLGTETGSLVNHLLSSNIQGPVVGQGATILDWSDRHAYEVLTVSEDGKKCSILQYLPERIDTNLFSEIQNYKFEKFQGDPIDLVYRNNAWRQVCTRVEFIDEYWNDYYAHLSLVDQLKEGVVDPVTYNLKVVPGKSKLVHGYPKVNVIFGVKEEYYDYSF